MDLKINAFAPHFMLKNQLGEDFSLHDAIKTKNIVLYFYPKDNTPGCTVQAIEFTKIKDILKTHNYHIVGISKDTISCHKKFITSHSLSIELLADTNSTVCNQYNCLKEKSMFGKKYFGIERSTFLINQKGIIISIWRKVRAETNPQEVLNFIEASNN